jgi:predicted amidophosphoribosyltransferase
VPTVGELTALYENFMLAPRPGPSTCSTCFTFTDGYERCFMCARSQALLDALAPISLSVARGQLHHALASYKRLDGEVARRLGAELAAVLWRFLDGHERCIASAAGTTAFDLVSTVPSSDPDRDEHHPLRRIVGELVAPTRARHDRLLKRSNSHIPEHEYSPFKYEPVRRLEGRSVLLIDDTWTTGASAQSAAAALKAAGAGAVAAVVIGRHLNPEWHENERRLRSLIRPFDWTHCVHCAEPGRGP